MIELIILIKAFPAYWKGTSAMVVPVLLLSCLAICPPAFARIPTLSSVTQADKQESGAEPKAVSPEQQLEIAEENIAIAFPQCDIHLDTSQSLRVEVVK